jgi:hypothetical protein
MRILVAIGLVAGALVVASPAAATDQSVVGAYGCFLNGGHVYRPAGTDIVVRQGWAAKNRGLVEDWLNEQTTTFEINGGAPIDASNSHTAIQGYAPGGVASYVYYDTGIVLAPGESMTFHTVLSISHRTLDGVLFADGGDNGKPLFAEPGTQLDVTCTVTGY